MADELVQDSHRFLVVDERGLLVKSSHYGFGCMCRTHRYTLSLAEQQSVTLEQHTADWQKFECKPMLRYCAGSVSVLAAGAQGERLDPAQHAGVSDEDCHVA